jgi:hypothetical protein
MAESFKDGCPAKSRRKQLAEASDLLHANCRHSRHRIGKPSFSLGSKLRRKLYAPSSLAKWML